jgi:hypothetical protein
MRRFVILLIAMTLVTTACTGDDDGSATTVDEPAEASGAPEFPEQVFFIGDSNTEGIAAPFVTLTQARHPGHTIEAQASVNFGAPLSGVYGGSSTRRIQDGTFDVVVLQEDLAKYGIGESSASITESFDPAKFMEYVRKFNDEIVAAGAKTVLYMDWEHDLSDSNSVTITDIAAAYTSIGDELGAQVAPVGLAFSKSLSERPDFDLYIGDREHSNSRGQYLAASVLYATIFDTSPEGIAWMSPEMAEEAEMNEEDAAFLDRIAWQTVTEYQLAERMDES